MKQLSAEFAVKSVAIARLSEATEALTGAIASASDDTLNQVVTPPWGMPAPLYICAQVAASHIWYHDGQLNYIQCLLGDDKVHWMGD
jgi:hypothetical protein